MCDKKRKIFYKKYVKEVDHTEIKSDLVRLLHTKYPQSLDSREGVILTKSHITYLQGISDGLECAPYMDEMMSEVEYLIQYIKENKEVRIWSNHYHIEGKEEENV